MAQPNNCPFDLTPLDQSNPIKTPNLKSLNYTNQDFWSMKTRLINFTKEEFGEEFSDFVESSLAIMFIENWAFLADTLSFKMDQIANEIFIDTVTEIENAFRLSRLVGFNPLPPIASTSLWTATVANAVNTDVVIATPLSLTVVLNGIQSTIELFPADSNNQPLFDQNIIIPAGNTVVSNVIGVEGRTRVQESIGTGESGQIVQIGFFPVLFDSVRVEVDGLRWNEVEYFTDSEPRSEYRIEFNSSYEAFVIFGTSRAGRIPSPGSRIQITYRTGGGPQGNITTGSIERQTVVPVPGFDFPIPITLRNFTPGRGGYSGDNVEDIRRKLPAFLRTQNRAVTDGDYKTIAEQFATSFSGQIGRAVAILRHTGCAGNIIDLYVLARSGPQDLEEATSDLKLQLAEEIDSKKMLTDHVCIRDGVAVRVDVSIEAITDKFYRKFEDEIREKINRRLDNFFALNKWEYGKTLRVVDIVKTLADITEIDSFEINLETDNPNNSGEVVTTKFFEIIRPDETEIGFIFE